MEASSLTLRLLLLFLPGIICFLIVEALTIHRERRTHHVIVHSFVFGVLTYFVYALFIMLSLAASLVWDTTQTHIVRPADRLWFLKVAETDNATVDFGGVVLVTLLAVPLGYVVSAVINRKWLHKIAHRCKVSNKFGDLDLWEFVFNSTDPAMSWVVVRDIANDLAYEGWVEKFSDTGDPCEIVLRDVAVFRNLSGTFLYNTPAVYLARSRTAISVEFPRVEFTELQRRPTMTTEESEESNERESADPKTDGGTHPGGPTRKGRAKR